MLREGGADGGLAGAGFAGDQAQAALLAVHTQHFEDFFLVIEQLQPIGVERVAGESKIRADHD